MKWWQWIYYLDLLFTKTWKFYFVFSDDTAMLWGLQFYNDLLSQAGPLGNVQSELLFRKDSSTFSFEKGWAFPRRIYFNGDNCVMPPPDAYPWLPNSSRRLNLAKLIHLAPLLASLLLLFLHIWGGPPSERATNPRARFVSVDLCWISTQTGQEVRCTYGL